MVGLFIIKNPHEKNEDDWGYPNLKGTPQNIFKYNHCMISNHWLFRAAARMRGLSRSGTNVRNHLRKQRGETIEAIGNEELIPN